ncbi:hypothetical protein RSOLAG22IIIB_12525 [Rhizoctonia solani]|uniref:Ricin B lectin domain-containing protein n=1 Tax=Rhizoctonia solani TaxID=456999 RepID=A0A0K6GF18_9AGAM|nr:unnamed protein product [Rhizoctonia solani]CUA77061.1 hypothetical protein RSOLAG22IIIB_12525 [Rhizoctonia solani]
MILNNGTYDIMNHGRTSRCAGALPGSIDLGTPVMAVSPPLMLPIEVKRVGNDTYQFRLQTNNTMALGYSEQARKEDLAFVKLMRSSQDALWEVTSTGKGRFRIHVPNTDRCWTLPRFGGGLSLILLSELEGSPEQDWIFQPLHA